MTDEIKIFLVGMPGCGKSTLGKEVAMNLKFPFIDLDDEVEASADMKIKQIFEDKGEEEFRRLEQIQLKKYAAQPGKFIMATGGGTPCFFDNMQIMKQAGLVIFLDISVKVLAERLHAYDGVQNRPLLARHDDELELELAKRLLDRKPCYMQAHEVISKEWITPEILLSFITRHY